MGNPSATSDQILSLPKGGGALRGLGETFAADLFTGTGNLTIPIALPPGRGGFQPELSLSYSSGNGNGPFGLGWVLGVPGVTRKTSHGVPRYRDDARDLETRDVFILSGAEDLVPVSHEGGIVRYRPRTEGLFARIERRHDGADDCWEVCSRDGLVSTYGTPRSVGSDPACVADPADRTRVFAWKISQTRDTFGNLIEYEYDRDTGDEGSHHWDQAYLKQIRYVDYRVDGRTHFLVAVTFEYEDRPDAWSEYRSGFEIRTRRRCTAIQVHTHTDARRLARTYRLVYLDARPGPGDQPPRNGLSLLSQIEVVGHDEGASQSLPPLEFAYTRFEPDWRELVTLTGQSLPAFGEPNIELVDLFGSGLPDALEMDGVVRYWRNLGDGRFDEPREMADAPAGLALAQAGVQLIDADGDGRTDLMVSTGGAAGYYPMRFGGGWDRRSFQPYPTAPSFALEDPEVHLVDLDGDGVTDVIRSGSRLECFFNDPRLGWTETRWVERGSLEAFPDVSFSDPRVRWADMSGDGLQDIVVVHDGEVVYWPNLGYGRWGRRLAMRNGPRLPEGYQPRLMLMGDVDGDGVADLLYVDDGRVLLWINQSGARWSDPIEIVGTPPVSDADTVRLIDLLGTGVAGVLWSRHLGADARPAHSFLDFTGRVKPYLLSELDNHMGAVTRIEYRPSTHFFLEDGKRTETRWATPLPFPVQVVARVERLDALSRGKLATEYAYHHGYWDGAEREFRGFGRVDQRDTEVFARYHGEADANHTLEAVELARYSPPVETRTWFHLGPVGDEFGDWEELDFRDEFWSEDQSVLSRPEDTTRLLRSLERRERRDALRTLRGQTLRTELYALDGSMLEGRPYTVTESAHGVREELPPEASDDRRPRIFFPHSHASRTTRWERGREPMTHFTFTPAYDAYGQPLRQISIAVPRHRDFREAAVAAEPYLATAVDTAYARRDDDLTYIVDRVAKTTTREIVNDGSPSVTALVASIEDGSAATRVMAQALSFYDGAAFQGLPYGQVDRQGALVRTEQLVLTRELLREGYDPPYLVPAGPLRWSDEYPEGFRVAVHALPRKAGYAYRYAGPGLPSEEGYFAVTGQWRYDFQAGAGRGLVVALRDALDRETTIAYEAPYELFPSRVSDALGLATSAVYDYRVLQPIEVTDANGNRRRLTFTPLGLPRTATSEGTAGENVGDTDLAPGARWEYDFGAFAERGQPVSVRTIRRVHHVTDPGVRAEERDDTIEVVEYTDGFGRLLQQRAMAEDVVFGEATFGNELLPADQTQAGGDAVGQRVATRATAPGVVVSGWQIYDNKGRVVERYEPFFSIGWDYATPADVERGRKSTIAYDPRGQAIRTVNPDGSQERVIYGVPDASGPDRFTPTPWEAYTYDRNDNGGRTHGTGDATHWDTPSSIEVDALGRIITAIARNGPDPLSDWYVTRSTYDLRNNVLTVTDPLNRTVLRYAYDLANRPLRSESLDAGVRRTILDAAGNEIERRDGKGALLLRSFDLLNRPIRLWARDDPAGVPSLRGQLEYGDGSDPNQPPAERDVNRAAKRLGRLHEQYDEAGRLTFETYDFKGRLVEKVRQVFDWQIDPLPIGWETAQGTIADRAAAVLDPIEYRTSVAYDALDRVTALRCPRDVDNARKNFHLRYNRGGALEAVDLDGATYVQRIAYNAKGQRTLLAYGNGLLTRYAYDPQTFRLVRLRTEGYDRPPRTAYTYRPNGSVLQDLAYSYDLAGNLTGIVDRTHGCGVRNNPDAAAVADGRLARLLAAGDALVRQFKYDPVYRLIAATGRESDDIPRPRPWPDDPRYGFGAGNHGTRTQGNAPNHTDVYLERYSYDPAGNLLTLNHGRRRIQWVRQFGMGGLTPAQWEAEWRARLAAGRPLPAPPPNRLTHVGDNGPVNAQTHVYDPNGNLTTETGTRHFEWNHSDRLKVFRVQAGVGQPSVHAQFLYDPTGQRTLKVVRRQGGRSEVTVYVDGIFEHHRWLEADNVLRENNSLHVLDGKNRIAVVRVGDRRADDVSPDVQYHLPDHLGSSHVVVNDAGDWVNREEHLPYGETSFGSFARKRYRFGGKERDEESGLHYHGARYYASWLGRWVSCDPLTTDGPNLYVAFRGDPINRVDPSGSQSSFQQEEKERKEQAAARGAVPKAFSATSGRWIFHPNIHFRNAEEGIIVVSPSPPEVPEPKPPPEPKPKASVGKLLQELKKAEPEPALEPKPQKKESSWSGDVPLKIPQFDLTEKAKTDPPTACTDCSSELVSRVLVEVYVRLRTLETRRQSLVADTGWQLIREYSGLVASDVPEGASESQLGGVSDFKERSDTDEYETVRDFRFEFHPYDWDVRELMSAVKGKDFWGLSLDEATLRRLIATPQEIPLTR